MKKFATITATVLLTLTPIFCQSIETTPGIPTKGVPISIYFNTSLLSASDELYNFEGDLYAHTGVMIEGLSEWQNVKGTWGTNSTQPQLIYLGSHRYKLDITPDIEHFYPKVGNIPIPASEIVTKIALVIRTADGSKQTRPDIFIDVFETGLEVNITNPTEHSVVANLNETVNINVSAASADSVVLYLNNIKVKKGTTANALTYAYNANSYGGAWLKATAWNIPSYESDSVYIYVPNTPTLEALPAGMENGINYTSTTSATLVLSAPQKSKAFVVGSFNKWLKNDESYMKKTPDGEKFWKVISGLTPRKEYTYQYVVDGISIADPYTEKVLDPQHDTHIDDDTYPNLIDYPVGFATGQVGVLKSDELRYNWKNPNFSPPAKTDLVIYELLLRDFLATHNYQTLIDTLSYLSNLGVNAIELMPINEFDGNESWGYNPSFYFAPDKYYGTKNKLKEFIDSCHSKGIAVILDVVLNHATGSSPMAKLYWDVANNKTAADNPWFNVDAKHDFNVFHDFNHQSTHTQYHAKRVMKHWINEYNVDGYRFDLSKGFTQQNTLGNTNAWGQHDATRVALWKMYADYIWTISPDFYVILEHFADNTEEKELANYGMMLWQNMNSAYIEASMGYSSNITTASYKTRGWNDAHNIVYMESHDEERMQFKNFTYGNSEGSYNIKSLTTGLRRAALTACFFITIPGPKMIWQFGELGYDISIDQGGRLSNKPIHWEYLSNIERKTLMQIYAALIKLKSSEPAFKSSDFVIEEESKTKRIEINHSSMDVRIIGNFDVSSQTISANFSKTGWWYDFFASDSINVSNTSEALQLKPGEYRLYTTKRFSKPALNNSVKEIFADNPFINWFNLYPNPVKSNLTIELNEKINGKIDKLTIFSLQGKVVLELTNVTNNQLNLSTLSQGIYLLKLESGKMSGAKPFIKVE